MKNQNCFLIIGSGQTSRHFQHYLHLLDLPFQNWDRSKPLEKLREQLSMVSHVLLLISDSNLSAFYQEHLKSSAPQIIHFSGALEIPGTISAHPLMTFSKTFYSFEDYRLIPFVTTASLPFSEILPGFPNPHYHIRPEQKPFYHALCVLSGNFTNLLWQQMSHGLKSLGLPAEIFHPYLRQTTANILQDTENSLTGPLARKDLRTVLANDQALNGQPVQKIYRAFVEVYFPEALTEIANENS